MSQVAHIGDYPRSSCAFKASGTATNPTTTTVTVTTPDGTETAYVYGVDAEVIRPSTGNFYIEFLIEEVGDYKCKWVGEGNVKAGTPVHIIHVES